MLTIMWDHKRPQASESTRSSILDIAKVWFSSLNYKTVHFSLSLTIVLDGGFVHVSTRVIIIILKFLKYTFRGSKNHENFVFEDYSIHL
jgi:hypothetical protein